MSTSTSSIIGFARRWLHYGDGTIGDLLVEFGMTRLLPRRLGKVLDTPAGRRNTQSRQIHPGPASVGRGE